MVPASFFCELPEDARTAAPGFEPRRGFATIGTFHHPPNVDSARWLAAEVWPLIRRELPTATMRVYGAYPTAAIESLHAPKDGFLVEGFAPTVGGAMDGARVLLAPLRFGAGIKGKIVDAWMRGLPAVTTPVGAEGMVPGVDELWSPAGGGGGRRRRGGVGGLRQPRRTSRATPWSFTRTEGGGNAPGRRDSISWRRCSRRSVT